jgi:hypothetical protein
MNKLLLFATLFVFGSFIGTHSFDKTQHPPAPEYSKENCWIALPWRKDIADTIPNGCSTPDAQLNAKADVFYIHPTVYLVGNNYNGDVYNDKLNKKCDKCVLIQGTIFNASGRVFAPRYRQAHIKAFSGDSIEGEKALKFAYADVKAAFEHYLKNWNKGRPIIIVGHSQGARHAAQLVKDFFDGTELQKLLIAAYPIGMPIPKNYFKNIPLTNGPKETCCWATWNTNSWGTELKGKMLKKYGNSACVNPLSWKQNDEHVLSNKNLGGVSIKFDAVDINVCDAKVNKAILWIHPVSGKRYNHIGSWYHGSDMNLFYMNLRQNAIDRVDAYFNKK